MPVAVSWSMVWVVLYPVAALRLHTFNMTMPAFCPLSLDPPVGCMDAKGGCFRMSTASRLSGWLAWGRQFLEATGASTICGLVATGICGVTLVRGVESLDYRSRDVGLEDPLVVVVMDPGMA